MIKLSPSLLAADPLNLGNAVRMAAEAGCDELHFDVMDAHFVPNLTFGPHILAAMRKETKMFLDTHLMVTDPVKLVDPYADAGAELIIVHAESNGWLEALDRIRARGLKTGVSIKPGTSVDVLRDHLDKFDRVLIMTVEPGYGGQSLIPETLSKARELRALGFTGEIEADGGIKPANMREVAEAGIEILVMGTAFFGASDPAGLVQQVHAL